MTAVALEIRLFGAPAFLRADGEAVAFSARKDRALICYLAAHAGRPQARDRLVDLVWPDAAEGAGRASLRQALSTIRKALGDAAGALLVADRDTVTLRAEGLASDLAAFEALAAAPDPQAAAVPDGEFLEGLSGISAEFDNWRATEQARLAALAARLLTAAAAQAEAGRRLADAAALLTRALAVEPLAEATHRRLMRVQAAQGATDAALRQFRALETLLEAELGVRPEKETLDLVRDIRARRQGGGAPAAAAGPPPDPELPEDPSIAVLPFRNLSADPEQEYFSDGITEDLITELSRFRNLFVIARNSAFTFKGQPVEAPEIGRRLGVAYVVEGSVRRAGERVRVSVQLIEAASGRHLWAERYDRVLDDIFALQDEVVAIIVESLGHSLRDRAAELSTSRPAGGLTAYDHYLRGHAAWLAYRRDEAMAHLERALAADPGYAAAHALLSMLWFYGAYAPGARAGITESGLRATEHIETALALDDRDPVIHAAAGTAFCFARGGDKARGLRHSDTSIALNPHEFEVIFSRIHVLRAHGRPGEAMDWLARARRLSPIPSYRLTETHWSLLCDMRDYAAALRLIDGETNLTAHMCLELVEVHTRLGHHDETARWIAAFERKRAEIPDLEDYIRLRAERLPFNGGFDERMAMLRRAGLKL